MQVFSWTLLFITRRSGLRSLSEQSIINSMGQLLLTSFFYGSLLRLKECKSD
jgi:hypothetical protein